MPLGMFLGFVGLAVEQPFGRRQTNPGNFRSAFERADLGSTPTLPIKITLFTISPRYKFFIISIKSSAIFTPALAP